MTGECFLAGLMGTNAADAYLKHRYKAPERNDFPLPDEAFVSEWNAWLNGGKDTFPEEVGRLLSGAGTRVWLEATPAGRIPVVYAEERRTFERLTGILSAEDESGPLPASVNAFTVPCGHPSFNGHRVICLTKGGYSALSAESVGMSGDEWMEKSASLRLYHECCHYFTLRALGGMKNHALDEIVADCAAQLAVFGHYSPSLQRKFFGLNEGRVSPSGRLGFYLKKLPEDAVSLVCRKVDEALNGLESCLEENAGMSLASRGPELIIELASLGIDGIAGLGGSKKLEGLTWK
jgi:hypothetical protein